MKAIKNAAKKTASAAGTETAYLSKKSSGGFHHEGDIGASVVVLKGLKSSVNLKEKVSKLHEHTKSLNMVQTQAGTDFTVAGGESSNACWQLLGAMYTDLGARRQELAEVLSQVKEEWKGFESNELKKALAFEDQINRYWSDSLYYGSHGEPERKVETDEKYRRAGGEFMTAVHVAHSKHQELTVRWTKQILDAEVSFYCAAVEIVKKQASNYSG